MILYYLALLTYQLLIVLCFIPLILYLHFHDKGLLTSIPSRLGLVPVRRTYKYWCHASSVGELNALMQIVKHLPREQVFITVMNSKAYELAVQESSKDNVAYAPLDFIFSILCFISRLRPVVYIGAESEVWPCQLALLRLLGVKTFMINGGLSTRSLRRYQLFPSVSKNILANYDKIYARSKADYEKFQKILSDKEKVQHHWNLKFDVEHNHIENQNDCRKVDLIKSLAGDRKIIVIGSSHAEDELYLFKGLLDNSSFANSFLFVIVPRHPNRKNHIIQTANDFGLEVKALSALKLDYRLNNHLGMIIVDLFGILNKVYTIADYPIVGGSFSQLGGHNPIEPALKSKPVFIGHKYHSFDEVIEFFKEKKCVEILPKEPSAFLSFLTSFSEQQLVLMGKRAFSAVQSVKGSGVEIIKDIEQLANI